MPSLSKVSEQRLQTCDERLQTVVRTVVQSFPLIVVCGHRTMAEQNKALHEGTSKLSFPNSRHNTMPSLAVDLAPIVEGKIPWDNIKLFHEMAGHVLETAALLGYPVVWGGHWKSFPDFPHFEIPKLIQENNT